MRIPTEIAPEFGQHMSTPSTISTSVQFEGRTIALATKHGKEQVIIPLLQEALGIKDYLIPAVDTDQLGTFSGEVERKGTPLEVLRQKCKLAYDLTGCPLVIASEGSFGPHPSLYFIPADDEWLLLKDYLNNIEISARELSTETNFTAGTFQTFDQVLEFATQAKFPLHALIIRAGEKDFSAIKKGIQSADELKQAVEHCISLHGQVHVETDMRAHLNPTRMQVIRKASEKLVKKARTRCPSCQFPGFDTVAIGEGLPCGSCGTPTHSILYKVEGCTHCGHFNYHYYPSGKKTEDPQFCPRCNP